MVQSSNNENFPTPQGEDLFDGSELFSEEPEFLQLYTKAFDCGLYREAEYICDLVLHRLCSNPFSRAYTLQCLADATPSTCENGNTMMRQRLQVCWEWRRYKSLFLQKRYTSLLLELDSRFAEVFLCWSLPSARKAEAKGPPNALSGSSEMKSLQLRCAFLKCMALEASHQREKALEFSDVVLQQCARERDLVACCDTETSMAPEIAPALITDLKCRLLGLQGRILEAEAAVDLAVAKYTEAARTDLASVPWVLQRLINVARLPADRERQLLDDLSRTLSDSPAELQADTHHETTSSSGDKTFVHYHSALCAALRDVIFPANAYAFPGFSYPLISHTSATACETLLKASASRLPPEVHDVLVSPIFAEIAAQYHLNIGRLQDAEALARFILMRHPLHFACVRILAEVLCATCWDTSYFSRYSPATASAAPFVDKHTARLYSDSEILKDRLTELGTLKTNLEESFSDHPITHFCALATNVRTESPVVSEGFQQLVKHKECPDALVPYYIEALMNDGRIDAARTWVDQLRIRHSYCPVTEYQLALCQLAEADSLEATTLQPCAANLERDPFFSELEGDKAVLLERWDRAFMVYRSCLEAALHQCQPDSRGGSETQPTLRNRSPAFTNRLFPCVLVDRYDLEDNVPAVYRITVLAVRVALKAAAVSARLKITNATAELLSRVFGPIAALSMTEQIRCLTKFRPSGSHDETGNGFASPNSRSIFRFPKPHASSRPKPLLVVEELVRTFVAELLKLDIFNSFQENLGPNDVYTHLRQLCAWLAEFECKPSLSDGLSESEARGKASASGLLEKDTRTDQGCTPES